MDVSLSELQELVMDRVGEGVVLPDDADRGIDAIPRRHDPR